MKSKGFTLIELLVVISIISMLSSVVLNSLNTARTRASDNAVKADMKQMLAQAELYRDSVPNFSGSVALPAPDCTSGVFNNAQIVLIKAHITINAASGATFTCYWDTTAAASWAFSVSALKGGTSWCVDNSGGFRATTALNTGKCS